MAKSPYITEDDLYRLEQKVPLLIFIQKRDRLAIGPKVFKVASKPHDNDRIIPTYVTRCPSQNPLNHNFREINKKKWKGASFKP